MNCPARVSQHSTSPGNWDWNFGSSFDTETLSSAKGVIWFPPKYPQTIKNVNICEACTLTELLLTRAAQFAPPNCCSLDRNLTKSLQGKKWEELYVINPNGLLSLSNTPHSFTHFSSSKALNAQELILKLLNLTTSCLAVRATVTSVYYK